MSKDFLNYLRGRVDPQQHRDQIRKAANELQQRASAILIDRDLIAESPKLPAEVREAQLEQLDKVLEDIAWRIQQLDNDLAVLDGAERNVTGLNRAARRRAEKEEKKVVPFRIVPPTEADDGEPVS